MILINANQEYPDISFLSVEEVTMNQTENLLIFHRAQSEEAKACRTIEKQACGAQSRETTAERDYQGVH